MMIKKKFDSRQQSKKKSTKEYLNCKKIEYCIKNCCSAFRKKFENKKIKKKDKQA